MAFYHRKLFQQCNNTPNSPPPKFRGLVPPDQPINSPPPDGPRRYPRPDCPRCSLREDQSHQGTPTLLIVFCSIGIFWAMVCCIAMVAKYCSLSNYSRRRNSPESDDTEEGFIDESRGSVLVHPIWYVNTVGLQQSVIDSIAVFKYKRDDGLIEGTECSVCLSEFQEDESLRLLPKCSHAFHIPCIDTWLRSHKNCPFCRALVVTDHTVVHVEAEEPNMDDQGLREDAETETLETSDRLGHIQVGEDGRSETGEKSKDGEPIHELGVNGPNVEQEVQPLRRSVSMDSSSASMIYVAMANIPHEVGHEGCSGTKLVPVKNTNSEMVGKKVSGNSGIYRLMKNSSLGRSLPKRYVSMKRSFSFGGKVSLTRHSRRQDMVLSF